MIKTSKIATIIVLISFISFIAIADRGVFGKRNKIHFNIVTFNSLKSSIGNNLKTGLNYKGNASLNHQQVGNSIFTSSIVSYQKGNTIYILPYRQKILIQSYTPASGYKLILRSK